MYRAQQSSLLNSKGNNLQLLLIIVFLFTPINLSSCYRNKQAAPSITPTAILMAKRTATIGFQIQPYIGSLETQPIPEATSQPTINLATEVFHHPDDLFSLLVPTNWSYRESQSSSTFTDPRKETTLTVHVVNTGYAINSEAFAKFIETREGNTFAGYENYFEIYHQRDEERGTTFIEKQFSNHGISTSVGSLYFQKETTILILDFWAKQDNFHGYKKVLDTIIASLNINIDAVSNLPPYSSDIDLSSPNDYFTIKIPSYWRNNRLSSEHSVVDTFYSPDESAILQIVIYDDGDYLTKTVIGNLIRTLLREQYTKDITISSDFILPDGREQLTWRSDLGKYQGITLFETRDTALLLVTAMWKTDFTENYQWLVDDVIKTYRVIIDESE